MDKPRCFVNCDCGDLREEHCTNRDFPVMTRCTQCDFYFGNLEKGIKPSTIRKPFLDISEVFKL